MVSPLKIIGVPGPVWGHNPSGGDKNGSAGVKIASTFSSQNLTPLKVLLLHWKAVQ